jgi:hypothetical protein
MYWIININGAAKADITANPIEERTVTELRAEVAARYTDATGTSRKAPLPKPSVTPANDAEAAAQRANYARTKGHPEHANPRTSLDGTRAVIQSDDKPATDADGPYTEDDARVYIQTKSTVWENGI